MMILLSHILIAVASLLCATYLNFNPSKRGIRLGYVMAAYTLASGTYLVISLHAGLASACFSGLVYLLAVSTGLFKASRRLAARTSN